MFPPDNYTFSDGDVYKDGSLFYRTGVIKLGRIGYDKGKPLA